MSILLLALLVPAPPTIDEPMGLPPSLQFVNWNEKDGLVQTAVAVKIVVAEEEYQVDVNGVLQTLKRLVNKQVAYSQRQRLDPKNVEIYDVQGKKVDDAVWQKAFSRGAVVAMTQSGFVPHSAFRSVLKEGTLIIVVKPMQPKPAPK